MKLQIKDAGAWRQVLSFEQSQLAAIQAASAALLAATGCSKTVFRISDGDQVVARCEPPGCTWRSR